MTKADERALRREMVDTCRKMNSTGINQGTAGNLSVRLDAETFLITPSSLPYEIMQPDDIMKMAFDGTYEGKHRPSSEWRFHRDILREREDINVVLHCHSIYATTLAVHHKTIPSFHYMTGVAGGTTIRCARYATFGTQELSDAALEALKERLACLLGQHGQIRCLEAGFERQYRQTDDAGRQNINLGIGVDAPRRLQPVIGQHLRETIEGALAMRGQNDAFLRRDPVQHMRNGRIEHVDVAGVALLGETAATAPAKVDRLGSFAWKLKR